MKVFISYSYEDKSFVKALEAYLQETDLEILDAEQSVLPGDNIVAAISAAIDAADLIIIIISKESNENKLFSLELELIINEILGNNHKKVIPILMNREAIVPPFINRYQALNLSNEKDNTIIFDLIKQLLIFRKGPEFGQTNLNVENNLIFLKDSLLDYDKKEYERKSLEKTTNFVAEISSIIISVLVFSMLIGLVIAANKSKQTYPVNIPHSLAVLLALIMGIAIGASGSLFFIKNNRK